MPLALGFVLATLASAYVCYTLAKERHADTRFWVWMGILFGPLAIPLVFFSRAVRTDKKNANS